jgi:hypothetical protein
MPRGPFFFDLAVFAQTRFEAAVSCLTRGELAANVIVPVADQCAGCSKGSLLAEFLFEDVVA